MAMRRVTVRQRRRAVVRRHHLDGGASSVEAATGAVLALHATDPASVYLSVLARSATTTLADVAEALYTRRSLVRWMAMRRTVFVLARDDVPVVQAAVSTPVARSLRRRLVSRLEHGDSVPAGTDVGQWLTEVEGRVEEALERRGAATGAELASDVSELRTVIVPRAPSDRAQAVTSPLLTIMGTDGRLVRGTPTGAWTSRHHRWEPVDHWWPGGMAVPPVDDACRRLARGYLARFGPATVDDLQWWTGWNRTTVRRSLAGITVHEVDLHGGTGLVLTDPPDDTAAFDDGDDDEAGPVATLLPALDPTPMGWKHREWLLGVDRRRLFDSAGNIGPTLWWDGEVVGSWAVTGTGEVRTAVVADRGAQARQAIELAAARLQERLEGAVVTPAARTPLERELARG